MRTGSALGIRRGVAGVAARRGASGFSLLELIVVLALVGLVTVLALPNVAKLYEGFTKRSEQGRILNQIASLGREAMLRGRAYVVYGTGSDAAREQGGGQLPGFERYALTVPAGWQVNLDQPLLVRSNGICLGATMTLVHRGQSAARLVLKAPYCRVDGDV